MLSINRVRSLIDARYNYSEHVSNREAEHKDLGVIIDGELCFAKPTDAITSKATKISSLGHLRSKRHCKELDESNNNHDQLCQVGHIFTMRMMTSKWMRNDEFDER